MNRISLFACLVFTGVEALAEALTVNVTGAKADVGQVICSLFISKETYLRKPLLRTTEPVNQDGKATFHFDLSPGTYAMSFIYDENSNGEMDTGFMRIPKELVGFTNNARGTFGPPRFGETSFELKQDMVMTVHLGKARD